MAVGFPTDKGSLDQRFAIIAWQLRNTLNEVKLIKDFLDAIDDADLIAKGYTQGEVTKVKAAYTDLDNYRKVGIGQGTQAQANDFFFNAKALLGAQ